VDLNHPLAGEDLHFIGSILEMRIATEEEIQAAFSANSCSGGCAGGDDECNCGSGCNCGCN